MQSLAIARDKRYTYEDYLMIEDDSRYEVLKGELVMVAAPYTIHQSISDNLCFIFNKFIREKKLGKILVAPTDVVLADDVVVQPDILFISKDRAGIIEKKAIAGPPDLVVEILSPSSTFSDSVRKKELYQRYGVKEYWLVFPEEKAMEVMILEGGLYKEYSVAKDDGEVRSKVLDGLTIYLKDIF